MTVFIAGSKTIFTLPSSVMEQLEQYIHNQDAIVVGDCPGVDAAVVDFFRWHAYDKVTVYYVGYRPRISVGSFPTVQVRAVQAPTENAFAFRRVKDQAMVAACDQGLMIWDGHSKGTLANIEDLMRLQKPVTVATQDGRKQT